MIKDFFNCKLKNDLQQSGAFVEQHFEVMLLDKD